MCTEVCNNMETFFKLTCLRYLQTNRYFQFLQVFRIPVTDLRRGDPSSPRPPHWKRHLHREILRLTILDARLEVPTFEMSRLRQYGTIIVAASSLNGSFELIIGFT